MTTRVETPILVDTVAYEQVRVPSWVGPAGGYVYICATINKWEQGTKWDQGG